MKEAEFNREDWIKNKPEENWMKFLMDESSDAIVACEAKNYGILYINHMASIISGHGKAENTEEYFGKKCYKYFWDREEPCPFCNIEDMKESCFREREIQYPCDGRFYRMRGKKVLFEGREVHVEYITDITEEVQSKEKIENLADELKVMTDTIPGGIVIYEFAGDRILTRYYSDGVLKLSGYQREDISRKNIMAVVYEKDRDRLWKIVLEAVEERKGIDTAYRIWRKDGSLGWIRINANFVRKKEGNPLFYAVLSDVDMIHKTEEKLRYKEERLKNQQQKNRICQKEFGISIWEYDIVGKRYIISENGEESEKDFFYRPEGPDEVFTEESVRAYRNMIQEIENGAKTARADVQIKKKDGSYKWYHIHYVTIFSETGEPVWAIGMSRSLEEFKTLEAEYQKEVMNRNIANSHCVVTYRINLTQNTVEDCTIMNESLRYLKNIKTASELLNNAQKFIQKEEAKKQFREIFDQTFIDMYYGDQKKKYEMEYARKCEDGTIMWVSVELNAMKQPGTGDIIGFIYIRDISREKFSRMIMDCVVDTDYDYLALINVEDATIFQQNRKKSKYVARKEEWESYDDNLMERIQHIAEEEREEAYSRMTLEYVRGQLLEKDTYSCTFPFVRGEMEPLRKKWMYSYLDESQAIILLRRSDVTELYQEQQRQKERLQKALSFAERASCAKSKFLSNMSHDMRTPMNAIVGFSDSILLEDARKEELREYLTQINTSGKYLLSLINDVLDMSRIESRKMILHPEPVNARKLFEEVASLVEPQMREKELTFTLEEYNFLEEDVLWDKMYMEQVLVNLLSNAVKFTPKGGKVTCIVENIDRKENQVTKKITVVDTGIGMSREFIPKIFEPFEQESQTDKTNYAGTGLGMAIVKGILDLMGGTISVESQKGHGSRFIIELSSTFADKNEEIHNMEKTKKSRYDFCGKHILLCEDHPVNTMVAKKLLQIVGCEVDCAENGKEGVKLFSQSEEGFYDLILMDIRMPVMDGLEAARQIRDMKRKDAVRISVIAMTANAFAEDAQKSMEAGMDAHLGKPVEPENLYQTMERMMKK